MKEERNERIPEAVVRRMPRYYRYLDELENKGEEKVSSLKMSRDLNLNASQIRRDLNCFGGFGQQGYGYSVKKLKAEISHILGTDRKYGAVIAGAGNIGQALVSYEAFSQLGFSIEALFDISPKLIGKTFAGKPVLSMEEMQRLIENHKIEIGVICTPKDTAQQVADIMVSYGIRGIWNFAPADVQARPGIAVENVHLSDSLQVLLYRTGENGEKNGKKIVK